MLRFAATKPFFANFYQLDSLSAEVHMLLALNARKAGYVFCHQHDGWTQHPFTWVDEMLLAVANHNATLELTGGPFGRRTLEEAWSIQHLVALRENSERYCRRMVAIEVSMSDGPMIINALRKHVNDVRTVIGTFAHICMAKLEIESDVPMRVAWQKADWSRRPYNGVIVFCHQNHRDTRLMIRRYTYFENSVLLLGEDPIIGYQGYFFKGFPEWWRAVQESR